MRTPTDRHGLLRDLRTVVVAVLAAGLVVATPSIAAKVKNADKVDGKHAVAAGASPAKRAGKLVATDRTGHLPADILATTPETKATDADRLDGVDSTAFRTRAAAPGEVLVGTYSAWGGGSGAWVGDAVTFPARLPFAVPSYRVRVVYEGTPYTDRCPGPGRAEGDLTLCVYEVRNDDVSSLSAIDPVVGSYGTSVHGFALFGSCGAAQCISYGSYAVRAGTAADALDP